MSGSPGGAMMPPWAGPVRLLSLGQIMRYHYPLELIDFVKKLASWKDKPLDLTDEFTRAFARSHVEGVEERCRALGLLASHRTAQRMWSALLHAVEDGCSVVDFRDLTRELISRIEDEISQVSFLSLDVAETGRWLERKPFGEDVYERFPSAIIDLEEASKCLALERSTAAVFHLMRVMEVALKATAKSLGVPYTPSWESQLKEIQSRIDQKWKKKGIRWKRDEPFFREVLGHLQAVKVAWRNPTMHIENQYTLDQAEDIFNAVRGFMRYLSTRLSEKT